MGSKSGIAGGGSLPRAEGAGQGQPDEARRCPECRTPGRPVSPSTVKHILRDPLRREIPDDGLRFCRERACPVLYFGPAGWQVDHREARVPVGAKRADDDGLACYCFDITVRAVREEVRRTGHSEILAAVTREVKDGNCACRTRNPSGACCLGDLRRILAVS